MYTPSDELVSIDEGIANLQKMFNVENFLGSNNVVTKKAACEHQEAIDGKIEVCTSKAIFQAVEIAECPSCHKHSKDVLVRVCLPHAIKRWGQGVEPKSPVMDLSDPKDAEEIARRNQEAAEKAAQGGGGDERFVVSGKEGSVLAA